MTYETIVALFEKHKNASMNGCDLDVFNLLVKRFPRRINQDVIISASHDQIWLYPELEKENSLTEEDVFILAGCGVFISDSSFSMFA